MKAEIHAFFYAFDSAYVVKTILEDMIGHGFLLDGYVYLRYICTVAAEQSTTQEEGLQTVVSAVRASQSKGELRNFSWIPGSQNVADGRPKRRVSTSQSLWS